MSLKLARTGAGKPHVISFLMACATTMACCLASSADSLPELKDECVYIANAIVPRVQLVLMANAGVIYEMAKNNSPALCKELQVRTLDENRPIRTRLLYAGILAIKGDTEGQQFLMREASRATQEEEAKNVFWVIGHLVLFFPPEKQEASTVDMRWAEEFMVQMLKDNTKPEAPRNRSACTRRSLALNEDNGGNFAQVLGKMKSQKAFPVLLEICRNPSESETDLCDAIRGLDELGDKRAQPVLLKILKEHDHLTYAHAASALAHMGSAEALPILLEHLDDDLTYDALRHYKDDRILSALESALPALEDYARGEARLLIIDLEGGDRLPKLIQAAREKGFSSYQDPLSKIAELKDERAIPFATEVLRTSPDLSKRFFASFILAGIKSRQSIKPLIDALDMDVGALELFKESPEGANQRWREVIAGHLRDMTGKDFGVDKAKWLAWYAQTYK